MNKKYTIFVLIILAVAGLWLWGSARTKQTTSFVNQKQQPRGQEEAAMKIVSVAFNDGGLIPRLYTCDGESINPPLSFSGVPKNAKALALIVDDPDAPTGTWTHWTMWNIDPSTVSVAANSIPPGAVQGQASSGQNSYGGPCPPNGQHRYYFRLYALDSKISIPSFSESPALVSAMDGHILEQAQLMGLYSR